MKRYLTTALSAMLFFACTLTNQKTENSESANQMKSEKLNSSDSDSTSLGLKITSALNNLKNIDLDNIDIVNLNGMWIIIENEKETPQSIDIDININDEDSVINIKNERLTVFVPTGSKTLFIPETVDKTFTNYEHATFVLEGNKPIDNAEEKSIQLDIMIKDAQVLDQIITVK